MVDAEERKMKRRDLARREALKLTPTFRNCVFDAELWRCVRCASRAASCSNG